MLISEEEVERDLHIDSSSIFALEKELLEHPKREGKYARLAALSIKTLEQKELELEIVIAEIMDALEHLAKDKGQNIPQSARGDIRKNVVPLIPDYRTKKLEVIDASLTKNLLTSFYKAMQSRNYKLSDLLEIKKRELYGSNVVRDNFDDPMEEYRNASKGD